MKQWPENAPPSSSSAQSTSTQSLRKHATPRGTPTGTTPLSVLKSVPHYPAEDEKLRATSFSRRRGGNVANTAAVLAQLLDRSGPALTLVAPLPDETSAAFAFVQDSLGPQVRTLTALCRAGVTEAASSYVVRSAATGSRTIVNFNGLVEMGFEEFVGVVRAVGEAEMEGSWWHFEVSKLSLPFCQGVMTLRC